MDQIPLVDEQIKDGRKLIERLNEEGVPVTAAAWIKETAGGQWYLYLVTPLVGEDGATKPAYRRITPLIRQWQGEGIWIDPFEVKVVAPSELRGQAIADVQRQNQGRPAPRFEWASLGAFSVEGAYIYPPIAAATR
jgi:hypothetical protein